MNAHARRRGTVRLTGCHAEPLEPRRLLDAPAAALLAEGFQQINWNGQQTWAKPGQWIVRFDGVKGSTGQQIQKLDALLGTVHNDVRIKQHLGEDGVALITAPKKLNHGQLKATFQGLKTFRSIEPDFALWTQATVNDPSFGQLWGLHNTGQSGGKVDADIDAPEAWDITRGNGSVVVGVIDSGVDYNHPDLAANMWVNPGEIPGDGIDNDGNGYVDDVRGWNFVSNNNNPMDDHGHGTHVAGTIAAVGNNGIGVAGVADAKIMALKFISAQGTGSTSAAIAAINYATKLRKDHGINVRITNNSWGGGAFSTSLQTAIQSHNAQGILFIAAAGNGGSDGVGDNNDSLPHYPSNYNVANVIAVAATDRHDSLAGFSNYGATTVHLAAPGVSTYSTTRGGSYGFMSGTSMATPHVAGVAALAFMAAPGATMQQVKDAIIQGVDVIPAMNGRAVSNGRLNADGTLKRLSFATLSSGVLTVTGTAAADTMVLSHKSGNIVAELNGQTREFPIASVNTIIYNAGAGNDRIDIRELPASKTVTINGGAGNDTVNIGIGFSLASILSNITVNGDGGTDTVVLHDVTTSSSSSLTYAINGNTAGRSGASTTTYNTVENLTLNTGSANDDFNIAAGNGRLATIPAILNINAGNGNNRIFLHDSQEPTSQWFDINGTYVSRDAGFRMNHTGAKLIELFAGTNTDRLDLTPSSSTEFKVHGNDPAPPAFGDQYRMNLNGVTGMQHTVTGTGAGIFTFTNRQPITYTGIERLEVDELQRRPYNNTPFAVAATPITIEAEHFDVGGQNYTYFDTTPGNNPGAFRAGEDVDIRSTKDAGGGFRISGTVAGEWSEYTLNVAQAGTYRLDLRVSAATNGARVRFLLGGNDITGAMNVPNTGNWDTLSTISKDVTLPAGEHILRMVTDAHGSVGEGGSYNWIRLTQLTNNEQPPPPPPPPPGDQTFAINITQAVHAQSGTAAGNNFNSEPNMLVKKSGSGNGDRETFIRIDLSQVPADFASAKLRLTGQLNNTNNSSINVAAFGSGTTSWNETTLTWNTRPASNTSALATASIVGTSPRLYDLDLTSYLKQLKTAGAAAATIILRGTASTDASAMFVSDESLATGGPQLIVSASSTPSPSYIITETAAHVRGGSHASTNFGTASEIQVKRASSDESTREAFIKYDLTGLSSLTSAKLRLHARLSAAGSVGISVHGSSNTSWLENAITWNNRPTAGASIANFNITSTTAAWIDVDVTSYVNAELAAGKQAVTLVLRGTAATSPYVVISSDETEESPQLVVTM